jgi:hypothetical protein
MADIQRRSWRYETIDCSHAVNAAQQCHVWGNHCRGSIARRRLSFQAQWGDVGRVCRQFERKQKQDKRSGGWGETWTCQKPVPDFESDGTTGCVHQNPVTRRSK